MLLYKNSIGLQPTINRQSQEVQMNEHSYSLIIVYFLKFSFESDGITSTG